jgi:hypothetical protein
MKNQFFDISKAASLTCFPPFCFGMLLSLASLPVRLAIR